MNNKEEQKNNATKKTKEENFDMDKFSQELANKIQEANKKNKKKNNGFGWFGRFNPLIIIITIVLIFLIGFTFFNQSETAQKTTLDVVLKGLKDNKYSQILIQDDGKVMVNSKSYGVFAAKDQDIKIDNSLNYKFSSSKANTFETMSLSDFVSSFSAVDVFTQFKSIFNNAKVSAVDEVVIGDNFIIGIKQFNQKDILIRNASESDFIKAIEDKGLNVNSLPFPVRKLRIFSDTLDQDSFVARKNSDQFSNIFEIDGTYIARIKPEFVSQSYVEWASNIYSFTDLLQKEGISLVSENFEIVPVTVPASISFGDIINIITLLGFVVLIVFLFRGAQSSGMGIMQFGQSKAKVFFGSKTDTTFEDVAGIDEARDELNEIVDFLKNPNKYRKLGARIPKGILMIGPPGTGKTLLARAIAGEARVPFFHTSGSEFEEMLVGAGASRVRDLFQKAKKAAPALIFIDEIDAVARKRGTKVQTGTTEQTLNQILVEMDGFEKNVNVIVLAATNRPDVLDPAILRPGRFDRQVRIELPDAEGRKKILEIHGKNKPFAKDVDLTRIAKRTVGFTGADLENILNEAAIIAANANKKEINDKDIDEAVSKVVLGPAKTSKKRTQNEMKLVAYHEAGHAVVSKYTPFATPLDRISIVSRGNTGGVTMFLPENDEYIISKNKLIADITVSLGGRAAEEIALEDISTGASNDIEKATAVARRMVQRFGMSEKLGLVQYGDFEENDYLGYAYTTSKEYSEKTAEAIDNEVRSIIDLAYTNAKAILTQYKDKLDSVAKSLLENEVLSKEEFEALF